jgi:uncharacterized protein
MKTVLLLALAALPLSPAVAQFSPTPPQINVTGSAEIKVTPDEICIRVGVETRHATISEARSQNDERIASALAFLSKNDIKEKDVQTDYINVEPYYESSTRTRPEIYIARKSLEIRLTTITNFEAILTGLLNSGVNTIHGVDFHTSQLRKYRDQARAMAIKAAREKADALAGELGVKRGKVYNISANEWGGWWGSYGSFWGGRGGGMYQNAVNSSAQIESPSGSTLSVGQISVSASVNVAFLIE